MKQGEGHHEFLAFLAARVVLLEATVETLLAYLPTIHADVLATNGAKPGSDEELAMKLAQNALNNRLRNARAFYENAKEQFPEHAEVMREHMELAHKKIGEMYDPRPSS